LLDGIQNMTERTRAHYYDMYHSRMVFDFPIESNVEMVCDLSKKFKIVIATGRPEWYRDETKEQLTRWGIDYYGIVMRPSDFKKSSVELKEGYAKQFIEVGYEISIAIDDRDDICDMYEKLNIKTMRIKNGKQ